MDEKKDIAGLCKEKGLRLTAPRQAIARVLSEASDHPDALEIHRRVTAIDPGIAIATVYRTLSILEENGILERHSFGNGPARFETADQEHHDHLINLETGTITEFRSDKIERLQEEIARKHGFEIVGHKLEIYVRPLKRARGRKNAG